MLPYSYRKRVLKSRSNQFLPGIASGEHAFGVAITEPDYGWAPEFVGMALTSRNGSFSLSGTKLFVQDAQSATHLICAVRQGSEVSFVIVEAGGPGVRVRALDGFMTSMYEVTFDNVDVLPSAILPEGWAAFERAVLKSLPVLCAYQVGECRPCFTWRLTIAGLGCSSGGP